MLRETSPQRVRGPIGRFARCARPSLVPFRTGAHAVAGHEPPFVPPTCAVWLFGEGRPQLQNGAGLTPASRLEGLARCQFPTRTGAPVGPLSDNTVFRPERPSRPSGTTEVLTSVGGPIRQRGLLPSGRHPFPAAVKSQRSKIVAVGN